MSTEVIVAVIGAAATLGTAVIGVIWSKKRGAKSKSALKPLELLSSSREARAKKEHRFDVFISAPLAGMETDEKIRADHDRIAPVVALLEDKLGFTVFWAGKSILKTTDFEASDLSAKNDVENIENSKYFLLLYPEKLASSVLFESGVALRACLTSIYFVRDDAHLPFLMRQASQAFSNVRIYKGQLPNGLSTLLEKHGKSFFESQRSG